MSMCVSCTHTHSLVDTPAVCVKDVAEMVRAFCKAANKSELQTVLCHPLSEHVYMYLLYSL